MYDKQNKNMILSTMKLTICFFIAKKYHLISLTLLYLVLNNYKYGIKLIKDAILHTNQKTITLLIVYNHSVHLKLRYASTMH